MSITGRGIKPLECRADTAFVRLPRLEDGFGLVELLITPTSGEQTKVVTVVVRNPSALNSSRARQTSTFDISTGS